MSLAFGTRVRKRGPYLALTGEAQKHLLSVCYFDQVRAKRYNLFFCNVNIYRSTGTVDRRSMNPGYVSSMRRERARSIDAKKTNAAVEMT